MRHPAFSATAALIALTSVVTLTTLAACDKPAAHDDLAKDLASVSSSNDLALAPTSAGRSTVSAVEQLTPHTTVAPSQRSTPHRAPHVARHAASAPQIVAPKVEPVSAPAPEPMATVADAPIVMAPRPRPMSPAAGPVSDGGIQGSDMPGSRTGSIWGVIIRGGVGDGDHCDPRPRRMEPAMIYAGTSRPQIRY